MKETIVFLFTVAVTAACISWGVTGHKTAADIAFNHLTPQAKAAVTALLSSQIMAEVAPWADEVYNKGAKSKLVAQG